MPFLNSYLEQTQPFLLLNFAINRALINSQSFHESIPISLVDTALSCLNLNSSGCFWLVLFA